MRWRDEIGQWLRGVTPESALVIGAGATGLTSAIFLDARGLRVKILEQRPTPLQSLRSTVLSARTLEAYDMVGLKSELLQASNPFAWRIINIGNRHEPVDRRLRKLFEARILPHAELVRILEDEQRRQYIPVARGTGVISISQSPTQAHAILVGGGRESADYIVAADGSRTIARTAISVSSPSRVLGWNIAGVSDRSDLSPRIAALFEHDATIVASSPHMRFVAQADDPTDDERIAWSMWLDAAEQLDETTIQVAHKQEQVRRAVFTLERFSRDALGIVHASHRLAVTAALDARSSPPRDLARIITVRNGTQHGRPIYPISSDESLLYATQIPELLGLREP